MAKQKGGPTFFEVLRTQKKPTGQALDPSPHLEPAKPTPVLPQPEPLNLERELRLESLPPPATTLPKPVIRDVEEKFEPDTKGFRISFTVALFVALIFVGAALGSFAYGVRYGRSHAEPSTTIVQDNPAPSVSTPTAGPAAATRFVTIKLCSWEFANSASKAAALKSAHNGKKALTEKGYRDGIVVESSREVLLVYGKYKEGQQPNNVLDELRRFAYNGGPSFARAGFVPVE